MKGTLSPATRELLEHWPTDWTPLADVERDAMKRTVRSQRDISNREAHLIKVGLVERRFENEGATARLGVYITRRTPLGADSMKHAYQPPTVRELPPGSLVVHLKDGRTFDLSSLSPGDGVAWLKAAGVGTEDIDRTVHVVRRKP